MFWLFKNKNQTAASVSTKTKPKSAPRATVSAAGAKKPDQADLLKAISGLEKQLRELKSQLPTKATESVFDVADSGEAMASSLAVVKERESALVKSDAERIIEGVFDGQSMVGADGDIYDVPANYASKSKLVEGDILKLTINNFGSFVYKQIKPIDRLRKVGVLDQDPQNLQFYAQADGKKWRLLTASVTYYKGEPGDEVVFLIPAEGGSRWAAVENIIRAE